MRLLISATAGFLAYGAWAYLVNMEHGALMARRAALTQGSYSFAITLILTAAMEWLFTLFNKRSASTRFWGSSIPVCIVLYLTSWAVNYVAGTPNILLTILPGALISSLYTFSYVATLERLHKGTKPDV